MYDKYGFDSVPVQVHAPLDPAPTHRSHGAADRWLLLLGCTAVRCGRDPGSWRAFRVQKHQNQVIEQSAVPNNSQLDNRQRSHAAVSATLHGDTSVSPRSELRTSEPTRAVTEAGGGIDASQAHMPSSTGRQSTVPTHSERSGTSQPFGFGNGSSFGSLSMQTAPPDSTAPSDSMSFLDLDAALSSAISSAPSDAPRGLRSQRPRPKTKHSGRDVGQPPPHVTSPSSTLQRVPAGPLLPKFYLSWRSEAPAQSNKVADSDEQHIAELIDRYQADYDTVFPCTTPPRFPLQQSYRLLLK